MRLSVKFRTGWWGPNPPYHHPVFVLTHHPRPSITMEGGTTFHFVADGIEAALAHAFAAADGRDVRIGGGERLFDHLDGGLEGYECTALVSSPSVAHVRLAKAG
jgi:hypothetical protein